MKKCIVLVSDKNYIDHMKSLIMQIKTKGNYGGDICVILNNIEDDQEFKSKGIYVLNVSSGSYTSKYQIFQPYFKKWD